MIKFSVCLVLVPCLFFSYSSQSGGGFSGGKAQLGGRTTKAVKTVGCSNLKQIVESDKIIIEDFDIINELSTFIVHGSSFQAEEGCNDDLVMCCVLF